MTPARPAGGRRSAHLLPRLLGVLAAVAAPLCGCGAETTAAPLVRADVAVHDLQSVTPGTLTVGVDLRHRPLGYRDTSGSPAGVAVSVAQAMAARLGLRAVLVDVRDADLLAAVGGGHVDVALGAPTTADAAPGLHLVPWLKGGIAVVTRRDAPQQPRSLHELCGLTVAVEAGTFAARQLASAVPPSCGPSPPVVTVTRTDAQALDLLRSGRVDARLTDAVTAADDVDRDTSLDMPSGVIPGPDLALAVDAGNATMRSAVDQAFALLQADGTYDGILVRQWRLYDSAV